MDRRDDARPDLATLVDWIEGRLDTDAATHVADAVAAGDQRTAATVAWLRDFLAVARSLPLPQPPPIVRQNLRHHFARWSEARAALDRAPPELTASMLFDSRQDLALVGVRGTDDSDDTVYLAFTTDRADVVLDVRRLGRGRVRMDGQVLIAAPTQAPVFEATASGPGGSVRTVDGDELGRFCLPDVPDDATHLRVTNGELVIVAALDLREPGR